MASQVENAASAWVVRFAVLVPPGATVLDLASGGGRHTRLFLDCGCRVTAVDRDVSQLAGLADHPRLEVIAADLEDGSPWPLGERRFACVIVTNYLHRPILPRLVNAVAPGGVLIYETFGRGHEALGRPRNPAFLLEPDELLAAVRPDLQVVAYEHGRIDRPRPAVVQRICAARRDNPVPLPPG